MPCIIAALFRRKPTDIGLRILEPEDFEKAIRKPGIQLIDIRSPEKYAKGYLPNALNLDFHQKNAFILASQKLDKEEPVYLYSGHGFRSRQAAACLASIGFHRIYELEKGFSSWDGPVISINSIRVRD